MSIQLSHKIVSIYYFVLLLLKREFLLCVDLDLNFFLFLFREFAAVMTIEMWWKVCVVRRRGGGGVTDHLEPLQCSVGGNGHVFMKNTAKWQTNW